MASPHDDSCRCCQKWRWALQAVIDDANARIADLAGHLAQVIVVNRQLVQEAELLSITPEEESP